MRHTIGISSGDPAGIGLEVTLKAIPSVLARARWVLFTDPPAFERHHVRFGGTVPYRRITSIDQATDEPVLFVIDVPGASCPIPWGDIQPEAGQRAVAYLQAASDAARRAEVAGIVTAPVSKVAIGRPFKGQTEFLANQCNVTRFAMAFFTPTFKVVLATAHMALREALESLSAASYIDLIRFVSREFDRLGFARPSIAVAGINPHAGESGMFGREDEDILRTAVTECTREGINVSGPHSADSLYYRAHKGEFEVVIAPYHDQGLIPVKLIAHGESVNVTLGLPYVRTSPDHGTAFDIAGKGLADSSGMASAMRCAVDLASRISRGKSSQEGEPQSRQIP
jgi:4-hydroxythreonine-4-phosphate dehydrogenase